MFRNSLKSDAHLPRVSGRQFFMVPLDRSQTSFAFGIFASDMQD